MRKVLVTGGAGFIGSHLVDALALRGDRVVAYDNLRRGQVSTIAGHVDAGTCTFLQADIRDEEALSDAMRGVDVVYHLAAQSNVLGAMHDTSYSFTTNVGGTYSVLTAALNEGVRRVVFSSSREVYGEPRSLPVDEDAPLTPKNLYGASKVAAEAYCRAMKYARGLDVAVLRFANVYGPRDSERVIPRWLDMAARGEGMTVFGGEQVLDFIPIRVAIVALLYAGDFGLDEPVNVGSGTGTAILDLARRIGEITGSDAGVRLISANECEVVRFVAGVSRMRALGIEPPADPLCDLGEVIPRERVGV